MDGNASFFKGNEMRFIIDIDGVISKKESWSFTDSYERQTEMILAIEPNDIAIKKVNELYDKHTIILHTSRIWKDYDATVAWLKKHGVKYHTLIMAKPLGDYYVDDHNMSIKSFLKIT